MKLSTRKLALAGVLIALGVIISPFNIPVGVTKCFPGQHLINVISAVLLGPVYALINGFLISLLRNLLGMGTLFAFPGSIFGAFFAGILYKKYNKTYYAVIGEIIGTGIIGAIIATPVAIYLMGKNVAIFAFVLPFIISSIGGAIIAFIILQINPIKNIINNK